MEVILLENNRNLGELGDKVNVRAGYGRKPGQEDRSSHFRKGVHGDWVNHFTPEHLQDFKERYEDLLFEFGYETEPDWDRKYAPLIEERQRETARKAG